MLFGKEFASQIVPEWQEAYMDYKYLKALLKDIKRFNLKNNNNNNNGGTGGPSRDSSNDGGEAGGVTARTLGMLKAFTTTKSVPRSSAVVGIQEEVDDLEEQIGRPAAAVNPVQQQQETGFTEEHKNSRYETKFFTSPTDERGKYEFMFFQRLDDEFNKVNEFYKDKVEEAEKEADLLNKQMDALIAYRHKFDNQVTSSDAYTASAGVVTISATTSLSHRAGTERETTGVRDENERSNEDNSDESGEDTYMNDIIALNPTSFREENLVNIEEPNRTAILEILNRVSINKTLETQRSLIDNILKINKNKELNFGKENLKKVEEQLKKAFIQFYQKLRHLKSYSFLNLLAFSKIMKKYDKVTSRSASRSYLNMLDNSYLGNSDDLTRLMERMEGEFIKHFSHSKGVNIMRPKRKRQGHVTTFSLGLLAGCSMALVLALVLIIRARNILNKEGSTQYMETMFPLYSLFGFVVLHVLLYGGNIYFWRRYRVNYAFIFGLKQGNELGYREVFLISAALTTLALAGVLANLDMEMDDKTNDYKAFTELIPLAIVTLVLLITFCPFNIIYRSSRFFILKSAFHTICAPLYKVSLPDFFFADQLTSQAQALRSLQFYTCYYVWGDYKLRKNTCENSDVYNTFSFILTMIPFWFRMLQCLRRLFEEKDRKQGYNALKYFSIIVSVLIRGAYSKKMTMTWWVLAWVSSVIAGVVSTYWDIAIDWGLLQRNSKNRWLRDKLLVSQKSVYFAAMALNILLRFAWLETVLNFKVSFLHREAYIAIVASLEIIRRGSWNFFRLENEHLNNVGHYRAFKSVPLPFNYDDDEGKDE